MTRNSEWVLKPPGDSSQGNGNLSSPAKDVQLPVAGKRK